MDNHPAQIKALQMVLVGIVDAVRAGGALGAPAGVLFAALQTQGCSVGQFNQLMAVLVAAGKVRRECDLFFVVDGGAS